MAMADKCNEGLNPREDNESEKPAKIARFDVDSEQKGMHNVASLKHFKFLKILSNDVNSKCICIQGALGSFTFYVTPVFGIFEHPLTPCHTLSEIQNYPLKPHCVTSHYEFQ